MANFTVAIIGAGFGGIAAGIKLQEKGIKSFVLFDRNPEVGGTWYANQYPGVEVDIPSVLYSYKFSPNPDWSQAYASGTELRNYANSTVDKFGIREHIRLNTTIVSATYDATQNQWNLIDQTGTLTTATFLISCHGALSTPLEPNINGLEDFGGEILRSYAWDPAISLQNKRVGIIGTGASAIQIIPKIAPIVKQLTVFQRTPIWVLPKYNPKFSSTARRLFRTRPLTQAAPRFIIDNVFKVAETAAILHNKQLPFITQVVEKLCKSFINKQVHDPELRKKLTPHYGYACKRPSFSNDYLATYNRANVSLACGDITKISETGIISDSAGLVELDILILATGFKVFDLPYKIFGESGKELGHQWDNQLMSAFEGIAIPDYPNLFLAPGPYGVIGFSWFETIELDVTHAVEIIADTLKAGKNKIQITQEQTDEFVDDMRNRVRSTVFASSRCAGSNTYYINFQGDSPYWRPTTRNGSARALDKARNSGYSIS